MTKNRKKAFIVGLLILLAYSILGTDNPDAIETGMFLEIISGLAVLGIAALMYPLLKPFGSTLSFAYLFFKGFEGGIMILAGVLFYIHSSSLLALREQLYLIHGYLFAVPALIFYVLLYKSRLLPAWISIWGLIATLLLIMVNLLELLISNPLLKLMYLPIVLNEFVLSFWLIVKGLNQNEPDSAENNSK